VGRGPRHHRPRRLRWKLSVLHQKMPVIRQRALRHRYRWGRWRGLRSTVISTAQIYAWEPWADLSQQAHLRDRKDKRLQGSPRDHRVPAVADQSAIILGKYLKTKSRVGSRKQTYAHGTSSEIAESGWMCALWSFVAH